MNKVILLLISAIIYLGITGGAEAAKAQNTQILKDIRASIDAVEEFVPGIKITEKVKNDTYKNMVEPVAQDEYGNPINF